MYLSRETQRLFARLYLEGLSSGDFEPAFRELLGERAPLSASTIVRLKQEWEADYAVWRTRPIGGRGPDSRYRSNLIGWAYRSSGWFRSRDAFR